ncbi:MAG: hypothetical protein HY963_07945 [Ignavibacteriales bacterium]|nr:hypothetical protein [Ignavibacteriales bacterium]
MTRSNLLKKLRSELGEYKFFQFNHPDYTYILLGYPHLRGFISATDADFWIEVQPEINIATYKIILPSSIAVAQEKVPAQNPDGSTEQDSSSFIKLNDNTLNERKFFEKFPEDLLKNISPFNDSNSELIKASIYFGENFISLLKSDPIIAYISVNIDKFNHSFSLYNHLNFLEVLLPQKRKEILHKAHFPGTQNMLNILAKFQPSHLKLNSLIDFRNIMRMDSDLRIQILKVLSHLKSFNRNLLTLLSENPYSFNFLSINAINGLIHSENFIRFSQSVGNITSLSQRWNIKFDQIKEISNLTEIENKVKIKAQTRKSNYARFPNPPITGTKNIIALRNIDEQTSWAKKQQNCIRGYIPAVKSNKCYF